MKRALAIFAKTPLPGRVKTRLSPPLLPAQAAELYRCMLLDIIERSAGLSAAIVIFYEGSTDFFRKAAPEALLVHQSTGGLGERLEHAFQELSGHGYGARVVIGTDSPDLPLAFIEEAFQKLEQGSDVVFGPAEDGGYYLVGVRDSYGALFQDIPWSSEKVLETSLRRAEASALTAAVLSSWHDVDSWDDLLRPSLLEQSNRAPRTRAFIAALDLAAPLAADAV
ncbi:TIGR04282 family arsenosugar biosynthesis glycosyltransferase [Geomonas agri]|uniref:TIGR04282 family arsenosugar biosynthesis glycosyltransferase n=1 Tax=Geomonas agri TaxID=2873702 RepID=UPI001CD487A8|nr:TIGR04282 family arsenosugar biosynthesis glycosyltransferase [Geomonas agri]